MKKMGFKLLGAALAVLVANVCLASQYQVVNTTSPAKEDVLTPGARLIQGLPGKNDFYILGRNEKTPTELTQQDAGKVSAIIIEKAANKAKSSYKVAIKKTAIKHNQILHAAKSHRLTKHIVATKSVHHLGKKLASRSHSKLGHVIAPTKQNA